MMQNPMGVWLAQMGHVIPFFLAESVLLVLLLHRLRFSRGVIALVLVMVFAQVNYLFISTATTFAPDVGNHLDYMFHLIKTHTLPVPSGWHMHQPPLYFLWIALGHQLGVGFGAIDPLQWVRVASHMLYLGSIIFSLLLIRHFALPKLANLSAIMIVLFWPGMYVMAMRINADLGFACFFTGMLYFLQRWHDGRQLRHFTFACAMASLALCSKGTGIIALPIIGAVALYAIASGEYRLRDLLRRPFFAGYAAILAGMLLYFGRIAYWRWFHGLDVYYFANVHPGEGWVVASHWLDFAWFNFAHFLRNPITPYHAILAKVTFWDFLMRTLLYGTEITTGPLWAYRIINISWCIVMLLCFWQIACAMIKPFASRRAMPLVIAFIALIGCMMIQRAMIDDLLLAHARRIFPLLTVMALLSAFVMQQLHAHGRVWLYRVFSASGIVFGAAGLYLMFENNFNLGGG